MKTINLREVPLSEILNLPVYPVADILPKLEKSASKREEGKTKTLTLSELADSIIDHGQQEAIVLYTGQILDGRNRRLACELAAKVLGQTTDEFLVLVEDFEGTEEEADEFVFTAGLDRRDLEPTQRAMSAANFAFNPETQPAFERMKERAAGVRTANLPNQPQSSTNVDSGTTAVADLLARKFRCSVSYVYDAFKIKRDEIAAQEAAERAALRAEEYELAQEVAAEEMREALDAGDTNKAHQASVKVNNAQNHKHEEREKAAELSNKAASLNRLAENLHSGNKKLSEVRKERKESTKDERELAIEKASTKFNKAFTDIIEAGTFLLEEGRPNDQENVRRKFVRICEEFGDIEPFEGVTSSEENREYWDAVEDRNRN